MSDAAADGGPMTDVPAAAAAGVTVRRALPQDLAGAGRVSVAAYEHSGWLEPGDPYREHLADTGRRAREAELLVAVDPAGTVLGTVTLCQAGNPWSEICGPDELEFRMLAVDPAATGRGVGAALVDAVIERARELRARRVVLCSVQAMHVARGMYLRRGFVRRPDRDWSPNGDMLLMAYVLDLD